MPVLGVRNETEKIHLATKVCSVYSVEILTSKDNSLFCMQENINDLGVGSRLFLIIGFRAQRVIINLAHVGWGEMLKVKTIIVHFQVRF